MSILLSIQIRFFIVKIIQMIFIILLLIYIICFYYNVLIFIKLLFSIK